MAIKHSTVTVGTTATSLTAGTTDTAGKSLELTEGNRAARSIQLSEPSATIYIGGPGVTTTDYGFKLAAGDVLALDLLPGDEPFAVAATGGVTVHALHSGV